MVMRAMPDEIIEAGAVSASFRLSRLVTRSTGLLSQFERRSGAMDTRWVGTIERGVENEAMWSCVEAFFDSIEGIVGQFTMWDPSKPAPRGIAAGISRAEDIETFTDGTTFADGKAFSGNPGGQVNTARAKGLDVIQVKNMLGAEASSLMEGDLLSILHGPNKIPTLYKCLVNAASNGTKNTHDGVTEFQIAPKLRMDIAENDIVIFYRPRGVFQLVQEVEGLISHPNLSSISYQFREVPEVLYL